LLRIVLSKMNVAAEKNITGTDLNIEIEKMNAKDILGQAVNRIVSYIDELEYSLLLIRTQLDTVHNIANDGNHFFDKSLEGIEAKNKNITEKKSVVMDKVSNRINECDAKMILYEDNIINIKEQITNLFIANKKIERVYNQMNCKIKSMEMVIENEMLVKNNLKGVMLTSENKIYDRLMGKLFTTDIFVNKVMLDKTIVKVKDDLEKTNNKMIIGQRDIINHRLQQLEKVCMDKDDQIHEENTQSGAACCDC